ncbi:MAG: EAL domain-containing protein [Rhizomicrobium sp.]
MIEAARLLGFAFANADFLFEVDGSGTVVFATGAATDLVQGDVVGKSAARLFTLSEAAKFATLTQSLAKGDRAGPFRLKLAGGKDAAVSMFRLPQNGSQISCTLSKPGVRAISASRNGLANRDGFLAAASQVACQNDALALVDLPDLPEMVAAMSEEESGKLLGSIGAAFGKAGAKAAGRISPSGFGVIADAVGGTAKLGQKIRAALNETGAGKLGIEETLVSLKGKDISDAQRDLVLRYVVDKFAGGQWQGEAASDAATQFGLMMEETQKKLRRLTETVADGAFAMSFQPIVELKTGAPVHFEALARFSGALTEDTIGMMEALGVSDAFDLAVAVKVLAVAESRAAQGQSIAFNISGKTICSPSNFGLLAGLLTRKRALAGKLLIEITESAQIASLDDAAKGGRRAAGAGLSRGNRRFRRGRRVADLSARHAGRLREVRRLADRQARPVQARRRLAGRPRQALQRTRRDDRGRADRNGGAGCGRGDGLRSRPGLSLRQGRGRNSGAAGHDRGQAQGRPGKLGLDPPTASRRRRTISA